MTEIAMVAPPTKPSLARRISAEALGSALLFTTVVGSGIMAETLSGRNVAIALLGNTLATGAILYVLIAMLAAISGAHFNPVVSLVMRLRGELSSRDLLFYVLAQTSGGIAGVLLAHLMFDQQLFQLSEKIRTGPGQWTGEAVATFGLILTILGTAKYRPDAVPATVALFITSGYWFTSSTSFANPAITVARSLSNSFAGIAPADVPAFIAAQIVGAMLAWFLAHFLFADS